MNFEGTEKKLLKGSHDLWERNRKIVYHQIWNPWAWEEHWSKRRYTHTINEQENMESNELKRVTESHSKVQISSISCCLVKEKSKATALRSNPVALPDLCLADISAVG